MLPAARPFLLAWTTGATAWTIAWVVLGVTTVVIVVLLRTRWQDAKPWKKCAILSLWVHVLLACLATNIRIGLGGPGLGSAESGPIRVSVIVATPSAAAERAAAVKADETENVIDPPLSAIVEASEEPASKVADDAAVVTISNTPPPEPDLALEAPALLPEPKPVPTTPTKVIARDESAPAEADPPTAYDPDVKAVAKTDAPTPTPRNASDGEAASAAGAAPKSNGPARRPGIPALYANRFADRAALTGGGGGGGSPSTERAVRAALAWLAASQEPDGHWDAKRHGAGQERYAVLGQNRGAAGAKADTGVTALALLAFLGAGHTHLEGPYADNVARGLDYLRRAQGANGNLGGDAELFAHMYCHSMATFAVSEACAMSGDEKLLPTVRRAVAYSLVAQHPTDGGWRYQAGQTGDTSQLGWQLMALRSAELAGVEIPAVTWTRVDRFLRSVERGSAGGLAAYRPEGPPSRAMTAEALFCRQLLTHRADAGLPPPARDEARRAVLEEPPGGPVINFYYWYYATIALHRGKDSSPAAEEAWQRWNESLARTLIEGQSSDGSWSSACMWGGYGGRVYTTALAAMSLEVYYRYAPDEEPNVARRDDWQSVPAK